jgi:hypothetical protein
MMKIVGEFESSLGTHPPIAPGAPDPYTPDDLLVHETARRGPRRSRRTTGRALMDWLWDLHARFWGDLLARPSGRFAFRFMLQPTMAVIAAVKHGLRDARTGRAPYTWTVLTSAEKRGARLREGLRVTGRIFVLGLVMDAAYQIVALRKFYPGEAVVVALVLAFVPYVLTRGPVARIASWWMPRAASGEGA